MLDELRQRAPASSSGDPALRAPAGCADSAAAQPHTAARSTKSSVQSALKATTAKRHAQPLPRMGFSGQEPALDGEDVVGEAVAALGPGAGSA